VKGTMTWYRILWSSKTSNKRGFELVEAESALEARRKFEDLSDTRRVEKVEEADLKDYEVEEPG